MVKNSSLRQAVKLALLSGAASSMSVGALSSAYAQDAVPADLEEITVTGSRIPNANLISASPVTQIDAEAFDLSGATRVEDLLNTYPQLAPSFDSFTVNPTTGFATADLRGLGTFRTLVLVNGHRLQPGGIRSEARDLNQIPAALVERVEVLTGGASAVYGSDAMAGVVNFILDNDFEGLSIRAGMSGYQHENDDGYMRPLMDARGFPYPEGGSGLDGDTYNLDIALGGSFAEERGHAMAYFTWRENDALLQGARDYSSCALDAAGQTCGGSSTAHIPNFLVFQTVDPDDPDQNFANFAHLNDDGSWAPGVGVFYNFAPINHYQRPDERYTFGGALSYEESEFFKPYIETMFATTNTSVQIAESGTFFVNLLEFDCAEPLVGSLCTDLGLDPGTPFDLYVGKRNVEGGPRIASLETFSYRVVTGLEGQLTDNWSYDVSYLIGQTAQTESNQNDFLSDRVGPALLGCPPGSFSGCVPYNVWVPGGVTPEAASGLAGTGMRSGTTQLTSIGGYVSGITPFILPMSETPISLVVGYEYRKDEYEVRVDANMESGNFTGLGGPRLPIDGSFSVNEIYMEAGIPLLEDRGALQALALDLGYRYSDYDTSGGVNTWKVGVSAQVTDVVRFRGSVNRAIRAPNSSELFSDQQISLWSGDDPCSGATPEFTQAECANTGVTASQYGSVLASPAAQYNQFSGGNPSLEPEEADTYTVGFVATPIDGLDVSLDYFDISIENRIGSIGAETVLRFCGLTGDPFLCDKVNRNPASGDLWVGSSLATSGHIENLTANFGNLHWRGMDLLASYGWDMFGGSMRASFVGTQMLEQEIEPLPGVNPDATFDCAGNINTSCQQPTWRHTLRLTYSRDRITGAIGWRYVGAMDYETTAGDPGTTDQILVANGNELDAWNYLDLTGIYQITDYASFTLGVQNVLDKQPPITGSTVVLNANSPGGYDQMGRFIHATLNLNFDAF